MLALGLLWLCPALLAQEQNDIQKAASEAAAAIANAPKPEVRQEKPRYWTPSAEIAVGFNQTSLTNWAAGGYNTLTLSTSLDAKANYKKDLSSWNNRLQLQYSFLWSADKEDLIQKSADRIYFESKWAYKAAPNSKWNYSASFDFRSQFTDTKDKYTRTEDGHWDGILKSGFMSPAYANMGLGMEWKPSEWFDVNIAPATGGFIICTREELRPGYGMKLVSEGLDPAVNANYRSSLFQFGAQVKGNFRFTVNDVFKFESQLTIFTDYLYKPFVNYRVNFDNKIGWQVSKLIQIGLSTWMTYDPVVRIKADKDLDVYPDGRDRIQFKEFLQFSIAYTFAPRR